MVDVCLLQGGAKDVGVRDPLALAGVALMGCVTVYLSLSVLDGLEQSTPVVSHHRHPGFNQNCIVL